MSYLALVVSQPAEQFVKFLQQQTIGVCMTCQLNPVNGPRPSATAVWYRCALKGKTNDLGSPFCWWECSVQRKDLRGVGGRRKKAQAEGKEMPNDASLATAFGLLELTAGLLEPTDAALGC